MPAEIQVVTLNIKFGRRIDRARRLFEDGQLARADLVLLQEMDAPGVEEIATALKMHHVYPPATVHPWTGRDFGNAVLSRWAIVGDEKIDLPHPSLRDRTSRAATLARVDTASGPIDVCSLHLATPFELWPNARRDQMRAVLQCF